jgi:hypothetical protein
MRITLRRPRSFVILLIVIVVSYYCHRNYQRSPSIMDPTKAATTLANDFDARLEQKLEQLKEVQLDKSWYTGELSRLGPHQSEPGCVSSHEYELIHRLE